MRAILTSFVIVVVGSIGATVKEGDSVKRGDELGWFAFGKRCPSGNAAIWN